MRYVRVRLYGRVQGVFFRESARRHARRLHLVGYVQNCDDGSIEITVSGPSDAVEEFAKWAEKGPPLAKVERWTKDEVEREEVFDDFVIR